VSAKFFGMAHEQVQVNVQKNERHVCSADVKLIAQAVVEKAYALISADKDTLLKYVERIQSNGIPIRGISITEPYNEGLGTQDGNPSLAFPPSDGE